ncbi:MAG: regulatory protein RecX [Deltaproteobacteria bacterium]|nr:regulatory protein RecX [Deltaproteobacteria bacterium]
MQRALRLLSSRERTVRELDQQLQKQGVTPDERAAALARVKELGYIDDASVARARATRQVGKGEAPRLVQQKLLRQGIAAGAAQEAVSAASEGKTEVELAKAALDKRLRGRPVRDDKERQRLLRFLMGRGHRPSAAFAALKQAGLPAVEVDGELDDDGFDEG